MIVRTSFAVSAAAPSVPLRGGKRLLLFASTTTKASRPGHSVVSWRMPDAGCPKAVPCRTTACEYPGTAMRLPLAAVNAENGGAVDGAFVLQGQSARRDLVGAPVGRRDEAIAGRDGDVLVEVLVAILGVDVERVGALGARDTDSAHRHAGLI